MLDLADEKRKARKNSDMVNYKRLKSLLKTTVRRDKNAWLADQCDRIQNSHNIKDAKVLFNTVKKTRQQNFKAQQACINDAQGKTLTYPDLVLQRWKEYGEQLFAKQAGEVDIIPDQQRKLEPERLLEEIEHAVKKLRKGKSPGLGGIPAELIQYSGKSAIKGLHILCRKIWNTEKWPDEWKNQEFVVIHKSGSTKDCRNYRTRALICHASKSLLPIILNRYNIEQY